ncbi:unnamed protein product [Arabis nemorensis]|uniref:Uncharacterized protein n=1 Tax=Arabis nemorensis TaxID=586526 RepID=A0A565CDS5_9BRAS|nr:unnamed protein product [Arabis nemorensis]
MEEPYIPQCNSPPPSPGTEPESSVGSNEDEDPDFVVSCEQRTVVNRACKTPSLKKRNKILKFKSYREALLAPAQ